MSNDEPNENNIPTNVVVNNIVPAMNKVAEVLDMSIQPIIKEDDGPAQVQQLIRCTDGDRDRWRQASTASQMTVSAWIRQTLNNEARNILECSHPANMVKNYSWARICKKCNSRI